MVLIIDKQTKELKINMGTNSAFPKGNIPNLTCNKNEEIIRIHDQSELAKKILNAKHKWKFNNNFTDIIDIETQDEKDEKEKEENKRKILSSLNKLDRQIPRIVEDLIEHIGYTPHESKQTIINQKKVLRQQLNNLFK